MLKTGYKIQIGHYLKGIPGLVSLQLRITRIYLKRICN
jgi:hypothetical protein